MTKHDKCRRALARAMGVLRGRYRKGTRIEMDLWPRLGGGYSVRNIYGPIWDGKACCKWRARARAAKVLATREGGQLGHAGWCDGE